MLNSVPHSRTKWPPRRFIETAGKTNPLSSPSAPSLAFRVYAPTLPSIRISASPGRPLHPLRRSLRPTPDLPSTSNLPVPNVFAISPPSLPSSRSPCSQPDHRNPQEFHFVCQPNYTPQFYTFPRVPSFFPPSYRRHPSLFPNLSRETKNSIFFSFLGRKEILIRRMCKIEREREREGGNYISSRTINNEFKFRIIERAEMISHS